MASLEPDDLELLRGENYAWFVTLDPDGSPVASITWVDADERHVLINTAEGRRKDRNAARDPRVVVAVQAFDDAYRWISVEGLVEERVWDRREEFLILNPAGTTPTGQQPWCVP